MGSLKPSQISDEELYNLGFDTSFAGGVIDPRHEGDPVYDAGWWKGSITRAWVASGGIDPKDVPGIRDKAQRAKVGR